MGTLKRFVPIGARFGSLVVSGERISDKRFSYYPCVCDCGNKRIVQLGNLHSGGTTSCGCKKNIKHGNSKRRSLTPEYRIWQGIRSRCNNPHVKDYSYYGGRGIEICTRWDSFENFLSDMGKRPPGLTVDRIDPNGNYEPSNCRWATRLQQSHNRRKKPTIIADCREAVNLP